MVSLRMTITIHWETNELPGSQKSGLSIPLFGSAPAQPMDDFLGIRPRGLRWFQWQSNLLPPADFCFSYEKVTRQKTNVEYYCCVIASFETANNNKTQNISKPV